MWRTRPRWGSAVAGTRGSWKLLSKPVKAGIYSAALGVDWSHMSVPSLLWKPIALIVPVFTLACEQTTQFVSSALQKALFLKSERQLLCFYFHGCDLILDPNKQKSHLVLTALMILLLVFGFNTSACSSRRRRSKRRRGASAPTGPSCSRVCWPGSEHSGRPCLASNYKPICTTEPVRPTC